ncbi:hypothetical protein AC578_3435 [Pseudocercospora eumusae]|uniref:Uncharacterized protein n=1 Tax=Pseudocercospora eumusae TaxID=321146 RepID=A0A139HR57_9PEZI|nr:hypothetical protein AC578_3435 [Pseudocercospora eumusae]
MYSKTLPPLRSIPLARSYHSLTVETMGSPPYEQPSIHHTNFKDKRKCISHESIKGKESTTRRCARIPLWALASNKASQTERNELINEILREGNMMSESLLKQQTLKLAEVSMCRQCGQSSRLKENVAVKIAVTLHTPVRNSNPSPPSTRLLSRHSTPTAPPTPASSITYGRRTPSPSPTPASNFSQHNPFQQRSNRPLPHPIFGDKGGPSKAKSPKSPSPPEPSSPSSIQKLGSQGSNRPVPNAKTPTPPTSLLSRIATLEHQRRLQSEELAILRREKSDLGLQVQILNHRIQKFSEVMAEYLDRVS